ncbi:nitrate- and nitrite sensing domain-containing protein, partial [Aquitalea magnusonii]|uniref:nitrate- and nitrite sensing domain-containing protein n=1 Tax=Aquitalea magnusonii TaxID=332411 RepID=UPI0018745F81
IADLAGSTSDTGLLHDAVALLNLQCQKEFAGRDTRSQPAGQMFAAYSDHIEQLIGLIADLAGSTSDTGLLHDAVALLNLQCQKEFAGRERGFINGVLGRGSFDQAALLQAAGMQARQQACASQLRLVASAGIRQAAQQADQSAEASVLQAMRQQIMQVAPGQSPGVARPGGLAQPARKWPI